MPANCICHPAEVPYKNDRAGHRPLSSPLAAPPSWGDVTPAATALASIWARIRVQVCVPVTCQKSCIFPKKDARRKAFQIQRQTQTSVAELYPNPEIKVQAWHHAYNRQENLHFQNKRQVCLYFSCFEKPSQHQFNSVCRRDCQKHAKEYFKITKAMIFVLQFSVCTHKTYGMSGKSTSALYTKVSVIEKWIVLLWRISELSLQQHLDLREISEHIAVAFISEFCF